jgi:hypothetical protein
MERTKEQLLLVYAMLDLLEGYVHTGIRYRWNEGLMSVGKLPDRTVINSRGLYRHFRDKIVQKPLPGCLLFFGRSVDKISHVAIAKDSQFMYEAGGGDSRTKALWDSIRQRAYMRIRPIDRRSDLVAICDPFQNYNQR